MADIVQAAALRQATVTQLNSQFADEPYSDLRRRSYEFLENIKVSGISPLTPRSAYTFILRCRSN